jgi:hypothetical protein
MDSLTKVLIAHFVGDWLLQNGWIAANKTSVAWIRFIHCLIYTACFWWLGWQWCLFIFTTHFIIDTYLPLYWFRRIRGDFKDFAEFKASFATPVGFVVNVTMDQIFHFLTFIPIFLMYK